MSTGKPGRWRRWLLAVAFLAATIVVTHSWWLPLLGHCMVNDSAPGKADLIVVLAGDDSGKRILKAGELVKQGYAPRALVSSPVEMYGIREGALAIGFAEKHGLGRELFEEFPNSAHSTVEEAAALLPELGRRRARRVLVVTSDFHTARANRIWQRLRGDLEIVVTAVPSRAFRAEDWWQSREGRKTWLMEAAKTAADFLRL